MRDPGNNSPLLELSDSANAVFAVEDAGKRLVVTGLELSWQKAKQPKNPELELRIDLADDGGEKIVSQPILFAPPTETDD